MFIQMVPPEVRQEIIMTMAEKETLQDPKDIEALFESPSIMEKLKSIGCDSWQALWDKASKAAQEQLLKRSVSRKTKSA